LEKKNVGTYLVAKFVSIEINMVKLGPF